MIRKKIILPTNSRKLLTMHVVEMQSLLHYQLNHKVLESNAAFKAVSLIALFCLQQQKFNGTLNLKFN